MNLSLMRLVPTDGNEASQPTDPPVYTSQQRLAPHVRRAIVRARRWLVEQQRPQGHWQGEQETAGLESQYILLLTWLDELDSPRAAAAARWLLRKQLPDGGWALYPDGKLDLSTSVLAYFALKLTGHEPHQEYMQRAREAIVREGGADRVDATARFFLALLGQIPYDACPAATSAALRVLRAQMPVKTLDARKGIRELFLNGCDRKPDRFIPQWLRRRAAAKAGRRVLESSETTTSAIIWTTIALKCLGCADDSPQMRNCRRRLDDLILDQDELVRVQPIHHAAEDTALALRSMLESGLRPEDECVRSAVQWLLEAAPSLEAGDLASAAIALSKQFTTPPDSCESLPPGLHLLAESDQADTDCGQSDLLDRTTVAMGQIENRLLKLKNRNDLEALGALGRRVGDPVIDRAIAQLRRSQSPDGSWGDIVATGQVLTGLVAVGMSADDPLVTAGANWLLAHQQACGGWGESPESREDACQRGQGPVTASQTAWAMLGLIAAGLGQDPATLRGMRFLVSEQSEDGAWPEPEFTARTPGGVICRSEFHSVCYPLLALARWAVQDQ